MSNLSTLPKGDSAWLLRKAIQRIIQQVSVLETNIGASTTGNSANTQIIFNDNGVLRGDAGLTYNATTDLLSVGAATITGDLTVRTNKLAVTSTGVGIGTATPNASYILDLTTANDARARQWVADSSFIGSGNLANGFTIRTLSGTTDGVRFLNYAQTTEFMRLDSSGNLGLGVTPSAWATYKAIQVGPIGSLSSVSGATLLGNNMYYGGGALRYIASEAATMYGQEGSVHKWYTAASGTAGNAITFTQAMTLDASGNLLVGTPSAAGSASNSKIVAGGIFQTIGGQTASTASGTAVTAFTAANDAVYIVSAYIFGTAAPATYNAVAIVKVSGGTATVATISSATSLSISVSGLNVQLTQTSGSAQVMPYNAIRIS